MSRHVAPLRKGACSRCASTGRACGAPVEQAERDPVVADGVDAGRALCTSDGSLGRVAEVVAQRDETARAFFAQGAQPRADLGELPSELPAYLTALAPLLRDRELAVDAGCGPGAVLDVLAPIFEQVVAVDREQVQLAQAHERLRRRGYGNVTLLCDAYDSEAVHTLVSERGGADVVFASRVLHHAPKPAAAVEALARLLRPGGALVVSTTVAPSTRRCATARPTCARLHTDREHEKFARTRRLDLRALCTPSRAYVAGRPRQRVAWHCMVARVPGPLAQGEEGCSQGRR